MQIRIILAIVTGVLWVFACAGNYWALYSGVKRGKHISPLPLIGSLAGVACILLLPISSTWRKALFLPAAMIAAPQIWCAIGLLLLGRRPKQK